MITNTQDLHARVYEALSYEFISWERHYFDAKAKFKESFDTDPAYAIEWHGKDVAEAQAKYNILFELGILPEEDGCSLDNASAIADILEERLPKWMHTQEHRLGYYSGSKSTNAISNVLEDTKSEVAIRLYAKVLEYDRAACANDERLAEMDESDALTDERL